MSKGLHEKSELYAQKALIYKRFAECEDAQGLIEKALFPHIKDKVVVDVGCGSGKYLNLFAPHTQKYIGIDQAPSVLNLAVESAKHHRQSVCILASAEELPLPSDSVDVVLSSWVWGTVEDEARRERILFECRRILKNTGVILLVENDIGGEFEEIRGRFPQADRTYQYNSWLEEVGKFKTLVSFETHFNFSSLTEARKIFLAIYGEKCAAQIQHARVRHNVKIFIGNKNYAARLGMTSSSQDGTSSA